MQAWLGSQLWPCVLGVWMCPWGPLLGAPCPGGGERGGELGSSPGNKTPTVLQVRLGGETGEVVRGLPRQKRDPGRNKKVGKFAALLSAKCSKESPAGTQKHTGASLPLTYTTDSSFCLGDAQFLWHQYQLIYSTSEMLNSSWHQEEGGMQPFQMPFSVPQLSTFRSVSLNTLFILPSTVKWLL